MQKTVQFQAVQFSITEFSTVWPIYRTLSGATTPGLCGFKSDGNKGVLRILQSSSITGASPSDCLVSYPRHSLVESYPSAEMQSVYSAAAADRVKARYRKKSIFNTFSNRSQIFKLVKNYEAHDSRFLPILTSDQPGEICKRYPQLCAQHSTERRTPGASI